ncbi:hypothetical protein [Jatrophihabitans fulvus]
MNGSSAVPPATSDLASDLGSDLVSSVMRTVAAEPHPAPLLDLPVDGCRVTASAVAAAVRIALDADPGVVVRRCRLEPGDSASRVVVWVSLAMVLPAWRGAASVRTLVVQTVRTSFGLDVERVDVDVVDVELPVDGT